MNRSREDSDLSGAQINNQMFNQSVSSASSISIRGAPRESSELRHFRQEFEREANERYAFLEQEERRRLENANRRVQERGSSISNVFVREERNFEVSAGHASATSNSPGDEVSRAFNFLQRGLITTAMFNLVVERDGSLSPKPLDFGGPRSSSPLPGRNSPSGSCTSCQPRVNGPVIRRVHHEERQPNRFSPPSSHSSSHEENFYRPAPRQSPKASNKRPCYCTICEGRDPQGSLEEYDGVKPVDAWAENMIFRAKVIHHWDDAEMVKRAMPLIKGKAIEVLRLCNFSVDEHTTFQELRRVLSSANIGKTRGAAAYHEFLGIKQKTDENVMEFIHRVREAANRVGNIDDACILHSVTKGLLKHNAAIKEWLFEKEDDEGTVPSMNRFIKKLVALDQCRGNETKTVPENGQSRNQVPGTSSNNTTIDISSDEKNKSKEEKKEVKKKRTERRIGEDGTCTNHKGYVKHLPEDCYQQQADQDASRKQGHFYTGVKPMAEPESGSKSSK